VVLLGFKPYVRGSVHESYGFGLLCEVRVHAGLQLHRCDFVSIGAQYMFSFQNSL